MSEERRLDSSSTARPRYFYLAAALILLAAYAVRVWGLSGTSLWIDEVFSDLRVRGSIQQTLDYLYERPSQGPLYNLMMHLFLRSNELLLRLPSVWVTMIGVALFMATARRLFQDYRWALLAGMMLAFNPYHVWLSRMARAYALLFTLGMLSSLFFIILLKGERRPVNWIVFVVSSMLAYLTHHFALALPIAQYVLFAFILRGSRGFFRKWIAAQIVAGIPFLLYILRFMFRDSVSVGVGWIPPLTADDLLLTLWNMMVGYEGALSWYVVPGLIAGLGGLVMGVVAAWKQHKTDRAMFYWLWLLVAPLAVAVAVSVLLHPLYVDRYFIVLLPAVLFLTLGGWLYLGGDRAAYGFGSLLVLSSMVSIGVILYQGNHEREDWRAAAQLIEEFSQLNDGLLVETPEKLVAILYYLDADIDYAWLSEGGDNLLDLAPQFDQPVDRLWVIYRNPFDDGHRQNLMPPFDPFESSNSPMPEWLIPRRDQVIMQREFKGIIVLLVDVGNEFSEAGD